MQKRIHIVCLAAFTFLFSGLAMPAQPPKAQKPLIFAVFEIVDCKNAGARPMVMKGKEKKEKYCVASKPIVDQTHLQAASGATSSDGRPELELTLTEEGGQLMEKATQRIIDQHDQYQSHLGIVVHGELLQVPTLTGVVSSKLMVQGGLTQEDVDEIVTFLQKKTRRPPTVQT